MALVMILVRYWDGENYRTIILLKIICMDLKNWLEGGYKQYLLNLIFGK